MESVSAVTRGQIAGLYIYMWRFDGGADGCRSGNPLPLSP